METDHNMVNFEPLTYRKCNTSLVEVGYSFKKGSQNVAFGLKRFKK